MNPNEITGIPGNRAGIFHELHCARRYRTADGNVWEVERNLDGECYMRPRPETAKTDYRTRPPAKIITGEWLSLPDHTIWAAVEDYGGLIYFERITTEQALTGRAPTGDALIPDRVLCNPPATIAIWGDGTKTVAKASEGTPYDPFVGVAICVAKKLWEGHLPDGHSTNGEIKRLIRADRERRAKPIFAEYRKGAMWDDLFRSKVAELDQQWRKKHPNATLIPEDVIKRHDKRAEKSADSVCWKLALLKAKKQEEEWASR